MRAAADSPADTCPDHGSDQEADGPAPPPEAARLSDECLGVPCVHRMPGRSWGGAASRHGLDHGDDLGGLVALLASKGDEILHPGHDDAALGSAGDGDATAASELEHPLIS